MTDKLIEEMVKTDKKYKDRDGYDCTLEQMIAREPEWIASRFRHMEQALQQRQWVSVEDRLPEQGQCVLVYSPPMSPSKIFTTYYGGFFIDKEDLITHWMPLPTPPEEAE